MSIAKISTVMSENVWIYLSWCQKGLCWRHDVEINYWNANGYLSFLTLLYSSSGPSALHTIPIPCCLTGHHQITVNSVIDLGPTVLAGPLLWAELVCFVQVPGYCSDISCSHHKPPSYKKDLLGSSLVAQHSVLLHFPCLFVITYWET